MTAPTTSETATARAARIESMLMAFVAGAVDTCGFIALFGLFTAHVTGNFVLIGASLAEHRPGIYGKLLAFPVFIVTVAAVQLFALRRQRLHRDAGRPLLLAQWIFLLLFLAFGVYATPIVAADAPLTIAIGMFGVAAMAIQNCASRAVFSAHAPTTVMTGNVTQMVMDLVELAHGANADAVKSRLRKMGPPVFGFTIGAVASGLAFARFGFWSLLGPIAALLTMLLRYRTAAQSVRRD